MDDKVTTTVEYRCPYCHKPMPAEPALCCGEIGRAESKIDFLKILEVIEKTRPQRRLIRESEEPSISRAVDGPPND